MEARSPETGIQVRLLGRFEVAVGDRLVDGASWPSKRSAQLVQLLALADGGVLARDQVIEALWPHLDAVAGAANLRKAAHHARRALGAGDAVVLRRGQVALFPGRAVSTDAAQFMTAADTALAGHDGAGWRVAAASYGGELLPESLYEEWTQAPRRALRSRYVEVLRQSREWERLVELEPADEQAHRELMLAAMAAGNPHVALQWYGRLRTALLRDLAVLPGVETDALYEACVAGLGVADPAFVGRHVELARVAAALRRESAPSTSLLLVRGPAGIGKSAFCAQLAIIGRRQGCVTVQTCASPATGPYAPLGAVVEDLVTRHRNILDRLGAATRLVLGELTSVVGRSESTMPALTRHQVLAAISRVVESVAGSTGVVLVVDDVDAADAATIDVLAQLAASAPSTLLVVLAYRGEHAPAALDHWVAVLARTGHVMALDLAPLHDDDAQALVVAAAPGTPRPADVEAVVRLAGGNPFFLVELARRIGTDAPMTLRPGDAALGKVRRSRRATRRDARPPRPRRRRPRPDRGRRPDRLVRAGRLRSA